MSMNIYDPNTKTLTRIAGNSHSDLTPIETKLTLGTHEVGGQQVEYATVKDYVEAYVQNYVIENSSAP